MASSMNINTVGPIITQLQNLNTEELRVVYAYIHVKLDSTTATTTTTPAPAPAAITWADVAHPDHSAPPPTTSAWTGISQPAASPRCRFNEGAALSQFCGSSTCTCVYFFRGTEDPARWDSDLINGCELHVCGWDRDLVSHDTVRFELKNVLLPLNAMPLRTFIDARGYGFLTFESHAHAVRAFDILMETHDNAILGERFLCNFVTQTEPRRKTAKDTGRRY